MVFYEINLKSIPEILFACSVSTDHYRNRFSFVQDFLEISVNTGGDYYLEYADGERNIAQKGMIVPITKTMNCITYAEAGTRQSHITVGVNAKYDCVLHDTEKMDYCTVKDMLLRKNTVLIPCLYRMNEREYDECVERLQKIIYKASAVVPQNGCHILSDWFSLAGKLNEMVRCQFEKTNGMNPYAKRYVEDAKHYISQRYAQKISVGDVAHQLGISEGYLQSIFKEALHMGVTEYINYYKIQLAKQYIRSGKLKLREISVQVGIDDPAYMSRLFKKVEGICYKEYCQKYLGKSF